MVKLGIPIYTDTYYTLLNGGAQAKIGQDMPNPVGHIFGISCVVEGVQPTDQTKRVLTTAQAGLIWLYLKVGTNLFMNNFRLDKLIFETPATSGLQTYQNPRRYYPCSIPVATDLKESYYLNPTAIGAPPTTGIYAALQIHYIDRPSYFELVNKGYLYRGVENLPVIKK